MGSAVLPLLCVLCSLMATGHALSCKVCMASFLSYCSDSHMVCPSGNLCGLSFVKTTLDGATISQMVTMGCAPKNQCYQRSSASIPHGKIRRSTSCCDTDNCNPVFPTLPEEDNRYNGLVCHTCVTDQSDWCYTSDTMRCTGNENMCLLQTTNNYAPIQSAIAVRGCATQTMCDLGTQNLSYGQLSMVMSFKCSNGSSALLCPLFLTFIVTLGVIKMFHL